MSVREIRGAGGSDEPAGQRNAERLALFAPLGERMDGCIVGIVDVPVLDVNVAAAHEPRRYVDGRIVGHAEPGAEKPRDARIAQRGVVIAWKQRHRRAGDESRAKHGDELRRAFEQRGEQPRLLVVACGERQIERVAPEENFGPWMRLDQSREVGANSSGRARTEVRVADDEELSVESGHGVGRAEDKSTFAG